MVTYLPMAIRSLVYFFMAVCAATPLSAHEFWFAPATRLFQAGESAGLTLRVGEYFEGDLAGFSASHTLDLRRYDTKGSTDLRTSLPPDIPVPMLLVSLPTPGTHMVIFNSQASDINLPADSFHAYLHDEGLDFIKVQRELAGNAGNAGRERYRRFVKTLIRVTPRTDKVESQIMKADSTHLTMTGQRLEIFPGTNPLDLSPGDTLNLRVDFDGKPLRGALLKAWHKRGGQTLVIRAKTGADGFSSFNLPYFGPWMISVVHMVPMSGVKDIDWDSSWSSLSFNIFEPAENCKASCNNTGP